MNQLTLITWFSLALLVGATNQQESAGQDGLSPIRFPELKGKYQLKIVELESPELAMDPTEQLDELRKLQLEWVAKADRIRGKAWGNLIDAGDKLGTLSLIDFSRDFSERKSRQIHRYPKFNLIDQERFRSDAAEDFDTVIAKLSTPDILVTGLGYRRRGIERVSVVLPKPEAPVGFDFLGIAVPLAYSIESIHADFRTLHKNERTILSVRTSGELMEVKVTFVNAMEKNCRRWIFDLSKGGVCLHFEDLLVQSGATVVTNEFEKVDDQYLPTRSRKARFNRETKNWESLVEYRFFELETGAKWKSNEFTIENLPIKDNIPINDQRTGKRQLRALRNSNKEN